MERPRRRFKKRYIVLALFLAFAGLIGMVVWQAVTAKPGPLVDYHQKMHELAASHQPAGPDRWSDFERALAEMKKAQEAIREAERAAGVENVELPPVDTLYSAGYGDPEEFAALQARARKWLPALAEAGLFEHTAALAGAQTAVRPAGSGRLLDLLLPYLGESRNLARIQAARMHLAAERGDWNDYAAAFEELLATARILTSQTTLIDFLVGVAIEALALSELRKDVVEGVIHEPAVIDALLAAMERQRSRGITLALEGERMSLFDFIQRVYTDDGAGDGRLILTELAAMDIFGASPVPETVADLRIINAAGIAFPGRAETVAHVNRVYDAMIAEAQTLPHERTNPFDGGAYVESLPSRQIVLRLMLPALSSALHTADQIIVVRAGSEVLLRIERYRLQHGEAPLSLAELAAADPEADLIDPMTGEPFLYTRLTDDPHGRPYLLYAAGADGRDDGGRQADEGPAEQAFRPNRPGIDYVLNPPPQAPEWDEDE
jgi:hypothetical protein